jgi:hypothetical protein
MKVNILKPFYPSSSRVTQLSGSHPRADPEIDRPNRRGGIIFTFTNCSVIY